MNWIVHVTVVEPKNSSREKCQESDGTRSYCAVTDQFQMRAVDTLVQNAY